MRRVEYNAVPSDSEGRPRGEDMAAACRGRLLRREARVPATMEGWTSSSPRYRPSQAVFRVSASLRPRWRNRIWDSCYLSSVIIDASSAVGI
jgi:hypothetical protein